MAHYDDVFMPKRLRFGSTSTPTTETQKVYTASRYRYINQLHDQQLVMLSLEYQDNIADIHALKKIWYALEGPVHSCLVRDWTDWNTTEGNMAPNSESLITPFDQPLQNTTDNSFVADGTTILFQAVKRYIPEGAAVASHTRTITKLEQGTVRAAIDGVEITEGVDFTVDYTTGVFNLAAGSPTIPPGSTGSPTGVTVTWGGAFWVPAAFMEDDEFETRLRNAKRDEVLALMEEVRLS